MTREHPTHAPVSAQFPACDVGGLWFERQGLGLIRDHTNQVCYEVNSLEVGKKSHVIQLRLECKEIKAGNCDELLKAQYGRELEG